VREGWSRQFDQPPIGGDFADPARQRKAVEP